MLEKNQITFKCTHYVKSVQMRSFLWSVFYRIQPDCGKMRTRKNSVFHHFSRSDCGVISSEKSWLEQKFWGMVTNGLILSEFFWYLASTLKLKLNNQFGSKTYLELYRKPMMKVNPFHVTSLFLYPLKISESLWFSDIFRGCREKQWHEMS